MTVIINLNESCIMLYGDEWGDECVCVSLYQRLRVRRVRRITSRYRKHSLLEGSRSSLSRRPALSLTSLSHSLNSQLRYNIIRAQPQAERAGH